MNNIKQAIEWFQNRGKVVTMPGARKMYDAALSALHEKQEREKGCEYCSSRFEIMTHHALKETGAQSGLNRKANYCPVCGRKLGENDAKS